MGDTCVMRAGVDEVCDDELAFEATAMSVALLDDLDLGGTYREADHTPSDPRTDKGVEAAPDDGGKGEVSEEVVVDTFEVEAALMT